MHWKDALARALRTLFQIGTVAAVIVLLAQFDYIDWTEQQTAAVMGVAGIVVTFMQNLIEDAAGRSLFYKDNPAQRIAAAERSVKEAGI